MEVESLFKGIAVIIDDEINKSGTSIYGIKKLIEEKNIPVLAYSYIPQIGIVEALTNISFIILDWEYLENPIQPNVEERILLPDTLHDDTEGKLIEFIRSILTQVFVPTFIFTGRDPDKIKERLKENDLWSDSHPNRIFIKQKSDLDSEQKLFSAIENWLKEMPSVYVLKEWEKVINQTKNNMFLELYGYSPNWSKIIWEVLKEDSIDNQYEFGEFVTRSFVNRIKEYNFDENCLNTNKEISQSELAIIIQGERYIKYSKQPVQAYTGDIFKDGKHYYLNIRAQCDLSRPAQSGEYNPILYCIKGSKLKDKDIVTEDIAVMPEGKLVFNADKAYTLEELMEICKDPCKLSVLNNKFRNHRNGIFFNKGELLEKRPNVIVACVAGEKAIKFDLVDIIPMSYNEYKEKRIGRLLPPYITRVQQKCSQYIVREGVMPIPPSLFANFNENE